MAMASTRSSIRVDAIAAAEMRQVLADERRGSLEVREALPDPIKSANLMPTWPFQGFDRPNCCFRMSPHNRLAPCKQLEDGRRVSDEVHQEPPSSTSGA